MERVYLITGVTGFLGSEVARQLLLHKKKVIGLRMPGDKQKLLDGVKYIVGDITKPYTLNSFFEQTAGQEAVVIHCAGLVSIASLNENVWKVNVDGTRNIVDLCEINHISKLIYVSSVHAIEENVQGHTISEKKRFSASRVKGIYGKSKAEATAYVMKAAERGLNAVVVHPSGILGPEDYSGGYMTEVIKAFIKGYFPYAIEGGYDFVDVRDVAGGILSCIEKGRSGENYILSGEYITIKKMFETLSMISGKKKNYWAIPMKAISWTSHICEKVERLMRLQLLVTPYSLYTLGSNGHFTHKKAEKELGYTRRPIEETLADVYGWLKALESNKEV